MSNKEKIDTQKELLELSISEKEKKFMRNTFDYKKNIPFIAIVVIAVCHQWIKYYSLLRLDIFFFIFTSIFYAGLIWAAIWTYFYQRRISFLFIKLLKLINENDKIER